jgi:VWFA-related protein
MMKKISLSRLALIVGLLGLAFGPSVTSALAAEPGTVNLTVTAVGKKDTSAPIVNKDDVRLFLNKERTQIADWKHGEKLYLAVVIDDSLESSIANQWGDLKEFLNAQPNTTYVSVSYARNGGVQLAQDFTNNHELAAKALRLPLGNGGAFTSPYLAILDLMKRWPSSPDRRSILLISSGIDYFRGGGFGPKSPDLDSTIERAQKQNINVWTIYAPDEGHRGRGFFRTSIAQSNLSQLSEETGAESFFLGTSAPVTLKPYFDEISTHLSNQYLLTFRGNGGAKGRFERVRVSSELPHVEFLAASQVFLPATK